MNKYIRPTLLLFVALMSVMQLSAQTAADYIENDLKFPASNYNIYPDSSLIGLTPAPAGKHPFYISHYGHHGSRYLTNFRVYDMPYQTLLKADSLGKLTAKGKEIIPILKDIIADSEGRWGDLSGIGKKQQRQIAHRMMKNFPEVFKGEAFVDARSTIVTRCVLSMGAAVLKMVSENPKLRVSMNNSFHDMWYMNHQNHILRDSIMTPRAERAFDSFTDKRWYNPRLTAQLFNDASYVKKDIDEKWFNYYLMKTALIQKNASMGSPKDMLINLFTAEDIHQFELQENAWWYVNYGPSILNGGKRPYVQRYLLRKMIQEADSIISTNEHGASLRFGHETVLLPLACLLGINGLDYQTDDLEKLDQEGWWARQAIPMAGNIQFIFYRKNAKDKDVVFKVLLNEREATLPIQTDIAPYYHWRDFRTYYIQKIEDYERTVSSR